MVSMLGADTLFVNRESKIENRAEEECSSHGAQIKRKKRRLQSLPLEHCCHAVVNVTRVMTPN